MSGEYGEPWNANKMEFVNVAIIEKSNGDDVGYDFTHIDAERIVACVNALDGLNPEAVRELIKAAAETVEILEHYEDASPAGIARDDLRAALEKVKK